MKKEKRISVVRYVQEFSIPLLAGVVVALLFANIAPDFYHDLVHCSIFDLFGTTAAHDAHGHGHEVAGHGSGWQSYFNMHFLMNDIFMVFFFGLAAKEITEACLPGGSLNPVSKAFNPLMGTIGGILGPVGVFLGLNLVFGSPDWVNGWGIPTATDIAIAWLVARFLFGAGHPAVSFLLLLAVADDAIGLGIIAIAYPDPHNPTQWLNALWILPGMISAYTLRRFNVQSWLPYILIGGAFCWWGLFSAHLHPALALVFVVPFLPAPAHDLGLFVEKVEHDHTHAHPPLEKFETDLRTTVDFGLFFFAFANAGVAFAGVNSLTWILAASLIVGKIIGITLFSLAAKGIGCELPQGMSVRHLIVASAVAGIGLTVALFVSGQAFTDPVTQGAAKMGALISVAAFGVAFLLAKLLNVRPSSAGSTLVRDVDTSPISVDTAEIENEITTILEGFGATASSQDSDSSGKPLEYVEN